MAQTRPDTTTDGAKAIAKTITDLRRRVRDLELRPDPTSGGFTPAWARIIGADRTWNSGGGGLYWPRWTFVETQTGGFSLLDQVSVPGIDLVIQVPTPGVYVWSMAFGFQIQWDGTIDPPGTLPYWFAPSFFPYDHTNLDIAGVSNEAEWNVSTGGDFPCVIPLDRYSLLSGSEYRAAWKGRYMAEAITAGFDNFQGNGDGVLLAMSIRPKFWTEDWQPWTADFLWPDTAPNTNRDLMGDGNGVTLMLYQVA